VMKESAAAALSYVKRNATGLGADVPDDWFRERDVHVHVPAGAIPKDGPSAGITIATALASLVTGRPVRSDSAMTGEITLTGQVLPIGGLKEKALAAQRAEIGRIIAPKRNEQDLDELPEHLRRQMEFVFVDSVDEVLDEALEPEPSLVARRDGRRRKRAARRVEREPVAARSRTRGGSAEYRSSGA
jgi:ATP-dependent Lon protease